MDRRREALNTLLLLADSAVLSMLTDATGTGVVIDLASERLISDAR